MEISMTIAGRTVDELAELSKRKELADFTGLSVQTLARWAVEGVGPKITKLGGTAVRYRKADVLAWLERESTKDGAGK